MKYWKSILGTLVVISGLFFYQSEVISSPDPIKKIDVTGDASTLSTLKDLTFIGSSAISFSPDGTTGFNITDNQLQKSKLQGIFNRYDQSLTQSNPNLEAIYRINKNFFRGASDLDEFVISKDYSLIFYQTFNDQRSQHYANIFDAQTKKVSTVALSESNNDYEDLVAAYTEGDMAYTVFTTTSNDSEFLNKILVRAIDLKKHTVKIVAEIDEKAAVYSRSSSLKNVPYTILFADHYSGEELQGFDVKVLDIKTGKELYNEFYHDENTLPLYLQDGEMIYRLHFAGDFKNPTLTIDESTQKSDQSLTFRPLVELTDVKFSTDIPDLTMTYNQPFVEDDDPTSLIAARDWQNLYSFTIIDRMLYVLPNAYSGDKKEAQPFYVFDLETGQPVSGQINIMANDSDESFTFQRLEKVIKP